MQSGLEDDDEAVVGQLFLAAEFEVAVVDGVDADDVGLADFGDEFGDDFIKAVVADFDAVDVADGLDAEFAIAFLGGDFEGDGGLGD